MPALSPDDIRAESLQLSVADPSDTVLSFYP